MRKLKIICFSALVFLTLGNVQAQDAYEKSIGIRGGFLSGITYKHFLEFAGAIEGIFGYSFQEGRRLTTLTGLYEHHFFVNYQTNLYAGGGLTLGMRKEDFRVHAEAIVGIEYMIERFPLSLSLDYKPAYDIFGNTFYFDEFAISARYIF